MHNATPVLQHFESQPYDPVKAHEYYMKNRELTGRSTGGMSDQQKEAWAYTKDQITTEKTSKVDAEQEVKDKKLENLQVQAAETRTRISEKLKAYGILIAEKAATEKATISENATAYKTQISDQATADRTAVTEKATTEKAQISDQAAADRTAVAEKAAAERAAVSEKKQTLIDNLEPIPSGLTPEARAVELGKRKEAIAAIRGEAKTETNAISSDAKTETKAISDDAKSNAQTISSDAKTETKVISDDAKVNSQTISTDAKNENVDVSKKASTEREIVAVSVADEREQTRTDLKAAIATTKEAFVAATTQIDAGYETTYQQEYEKILATVPGKVATPKSGGSSKKTSTIAKPKVTPPKKAVVKSVSYDPTTHKAYGYNKGG